MKLIGPVSASLRVEASSKLAGSLLLVMWCQACPSYKSYIRSHEDECLKCEVNSFFKLRWIINIYTWRPIQHIKYWYYDFAKAALPWCFPLWRACLLEPLRRFPQVEKQSLVEKPPCNPAHRSDWVAYFPELYHNKQITLEKLLHETIENTFVMGGLMNLLTWHV